MPLLNRKEKGMNNTYARTPFYTDIWTKIRKWQNKHDVSDAQLAADLRVTEKTLKVYDKSAHHLTLEKIDNLLTAEGRSGLVLMTKRVRTSITRHEKYFVGGAHQKKNISEK